MLKTKSYDKNKKQPAIMSSICTGEQVAGFKNLETGKFEDIVAIKSPKDLKKFLKTYGIDEKDIIKMW